MLLMCSQPDLSPGKVLLFWLVTNVSDVIILLFPTAFIFLKSSILSSSDIIETLGVINLGGATVACTLSVGNAIGTLICAIIVISLGNTLDCFIGVSW